MRTLLTSFGIGQSDMPGSSYFRRPPLVTTDRLAPQHLGSLDFFPDYATLLLSERILLDEMSFDLLKSGKSDDQFAKAYQLYAALKSEGLVEVYDYEAVLAGNPDTVERAIAADLQNVPLWIEACVESSDLWGALGDILRARGVGLRDPMLGYKGHVLRNDLNMIRTSWNVYCADQARGGGKGDDLRREVARNLDTFLRYVNVNMLLANHFDATIADWFDFRPFYERKFVGSSQAEVKRGHISKLFELSFPFYADFSVERLARLLRDKRIEELRALVDSAQRGEVEFDAEFGARTLAEAFEIERSLANWRNVVAYASTPLGAIPLVGGVAQKAVEELALLNVSRHERKSLQWFYLISEP